MIGGGSGFELGQRRFRWHIKKKLFNEKEWNRLFRAVKESPSLERCADVALMALRSSDGTQ